MASSPSPHRTSGIILPGTVEELIARICRDQSLHPPDHGARAKLSALGEEASLALLRRVCASRIYNFSGLIVFMAKRPEFAAPQTNADPVPELVTALRSPELVTALRSPELSTT